MHLEIVAEENVEKNVINVYYIRKEYSYKIEYYADSIDTDPIHITDAVQEKYGTQLNEDLVTEDLGKNWINAYKPEGYKAGEVQGYITIANNNNNVIKVVYTKRTDIKYTVKYYFNNVEDKDKGYTDTATFKDKITEVKDYSNNGEWSKDTSKSTVLPYTIAVTGNVIKVYYIKPVIEVTKSKNSDTVEYGDTITYTITAENKGYKEGNVKISDTIPEGTNLVGEITATGLDNITEEQLEKGINLTVPAKTASGNGKATVEFTVKVISKPGVEITNTAIVNDNTETNTVTNNVEKTITINPKSEKAVMKNSNIVIVLDTSGSMDYDSTELTKCEGGFFHSHQLNGCTQIDGVWYRKASRLEVAKKVTNNFIDTAFETQGNALSVVKFSYSSNAKVVGTATNTSEATALKNSVNNLRASGGTVMSSALQVAEQEIKELKALNPDNANIVIFVSDGEPDGDTNRAIESAAESLQKQATVYTVAFDSDISILKDTIATDENKYYTTSNSSSLGDIFTDISLDFTDNKQDVQSNSGKVELTNIVADEKHPIVIYVNGIKTETINSLPSDATGKVIYENGKYYIDLTKFEADARIEIEYCTKA